MKRTVAVALGVFAAGLSALALGPAVRAAQDAEDGPKVEKRVIVRHAGGSGFLGIGLEDVAGEARGAKVRSVESGSAAEKAGIKQDDVIVRFDGESVRSATQLSRLVGETPAGRAVPLEVSRGGATQKLTATLGERRMRVFEGEDFPGMRQFQFELPEPPEAPEAPEPPHAGRVPHAAPAPSAPHAPGAPPPPHAWRFGEGDMMFRVLPGMGGPRKLGLEYIEMGEQLAAAYKLSAKGGVLVTSVDPDGPAAKAGVKAGDAIVKFDGKAVADAGDLRDAVAAAEGGKDVALTVQRDGRPLDLKATLAKPEPLKHRHAAGGVTL
jgi:predicted metalloprotease with PDZ domain